MAQHRKSDKQRRRRRRHDLTALARQTNHVLVTGVVVFTAAIILGRLLDPAMFGLQRWLSGLVGATVTAVVFGPFIVDLPKALFLLLVAFPLGRITVTRPWLAAVGLVLLVYGFHVSVDYVLGVHHVTWLQWQAFVGRLLAAAAVTWGVARLTARGIRAAEAADRRGATPKNRTGKDRGKPTAAKASPDEAEASTDAEAAQKEEAAGPQDQDDAAAGEAALSCKRTAAPDVMESER